MVPYCIRGNYAVKQHDFPFFMIFVTSHRSFFLSLITLSRYSIEEKIARKIIHEDIKNYSSVAVWVNLNVCTVAANDENFRLWKHRGSGPVFFSFIDQTISLPVDVITMGSKSGTAGMVPGLRPWWTIKGTSGSFVQKKCFLVVHAKTELCLVAISLLIVSFFLLGDS